MFNTSQRLVQDLTPVQRMDSISAILALGVLRARSKKDKDTSVLTAKTSREGLAFLAKESVIQGQKHSLKR